MHGRRGAVSHSRRHVAREHCRRYGATSRIFPDEFADKRSQMRRGADGETAALTFPTAHVVVETACRQPPLAASSATSALASNARRAGRVGSMDFSISE